MLVFFPALVLAALPAGLILAYVYKLDRAKPEPVGLIGKSVLYGFMAVVPALILELGLSRFLPEAQGLPRAFIDAFIIAAMIEEGVKLFFVRRYLYKRPEFDEAADGIVYAVCVSLGFAFVENFLYGYNDYMVLLLRSVSAVPLHALAAGAMGYYIGLDKLGERKKALPQGQWKKGFAWAVLIHGMYNFFLMTGGYAVFLIFPLIFVAFRVLRKLYARALDSDKDGSALP